MDIAELGLVIRSDGVVVAKDRLKDFEGQAGRAEKATDGMARAVRMLTPLVAALGAAFSVRTLVDYADAWSDMRSRVGAAIKDMEAAPRMMERLVQMANASYSPLEQTVEIYSRNVSVLKELGVNAAGAADFTESLNHMLVITATRGERAASVQNALAKAMAVGKLQADGLETVLANGGRVAEALAAELDTTVSGLRKMASEGKITGAVIANALLGSLEQVREEAAEMPATIGDALTRVQNNMTALIGTFDQTYGISGKVAEAIMLLADNLHMLGPIVAGLAATIGVALVPSLWSATAAAAALAAALLANPLTWVALAVGAVVAAVVVLIQEMGGLQAAFLMAQAVALDVWDRIKAGGQSLAAFMDGIADKVAASFHAAWANILQGFVGLMNAIAGPGNPMSMGAAEGWMGAMGSASQLEASAAAKFANGAALWGRATGPGLRMDSIGGGSTWDAFQAEFGETESAANAAATAIGGVSGAAKAANDNIKAVDDKLGDFGIKAFNVFTSLRDAMQGMGKGLFDAFKKGGDVAGNVLDMLMGKLEQFASSWLDNIVNNGINALFGMFGNSAGFGWGVKGGFMGQTGKPGIFGIPGMANGGTVASAGLSWVGERGPELLNLPRGAQVIPNGPAMAMAANQNSPTVNLNFIDNVGVSVEKGPMESDGQGGYRRDVILNRAVASAIAQPGPAQKAVRTTGQLVRR